MVDIINQISNEELIVVNKPRTFLKWNNTESGRDKEEIFERIDEDEYVYYVNQYNNDIIDMDFDFFKTLEQIYQKALLKNK